MEIPICELGHHRFSERNAVALVVGAEQDDVTLAFLLNGYD